MKEKASKKRRAFQYATAVVIIVIMASFLIPHGPPSIHIYFLAFNVTSEDALPYNSNYVKFENMIIQESGYPINGVELGFRGYNCAFSITDPSDIIYRPLHCLSQSDLSGVLTYLGRITVEGTIHYVEFDSGFRPVLIVKEWKIL